MSELTYTLVVNNTASGTYSDAADVFAADLDNAASEGKLAVMLDGEYSASNVAAGSKRIKLLTAVPNSPKNDVFQTPEFKASEIVYYEYFPYFAGTQQAIYINYTTVQEDLFLRIEERNGVNVNNTFTVSSTTGVPGLIEQLEERRYTFGIEKIKFQAAGSFGYLLVTVEPTSTYSYVFTANEGAAIIDTQASANLQPRTGDFESVQAAEKESNISSGVYNLWSHPIVQPKHYTWNAGADIFDLIVITVEQVNRGRVSRFNVKLFVAAGSEADYIPAAIDTLLGKTPVVNVDTAATLSSLGLSIAGFDNMDYTNIAEDTKFTVTYAGADVGTGDNAGTLDYTITIYGYSETTYLPEVELATLSETADIEAQSGTVLTSENVVTFMDSYMQNAVFGTLLLKIEGYVTDATGNVSPVIYSDAELYVSDIPPAIFASAVEIGNESASLYGTGTYDVDVDNLIGGNVKLFVWVTSSGAFELVIDNRDVETIVDLGDLSNPPGSGSTSHEVQTAVSWADIHAEGTDGTVTMTLRATDDTGTVNLATWTFTYDYPEPEVVNYAFDLSKVYFTNGTYSTGAATMDGQNSWNISPATSNTALDVGIISSGVLLSGFFHATFVYGGIPYEMSLGPKPLTAGASFSQRAFVNQLNPSQNFTASIIANSIPGGGTVTIPVTLYYSEQEVPIEEMQQIPAGFIVVYTP